MKHKYAWCWIIIGAMLLLAALFLVLYNLHADRESGTASREALAELKQMITQSSVTEKETDYYFSPEDLYDEYEQTEPTTEAVDPVIEINGKQYSGIISIPSLDIELPVLTNWNYTNLRIAPCKYDGSAAAGNLLIAAHNYSSHFGKIQSLNTGDRITFTDINGNLYEYEITQTEMIDGYDIATMKSGAEEWDLTLFTCTLSGRSRVSVRAVQVN